MKYHRFRYVGGDFDGIVYWWRCKTPPATQRFQEWNGRRLIAETYYTLDVKDGENVYTFARVEKRGIIT